MNPEHLSHEQDPAVTAALALEQERTAENDRRLEIAATISDKAVPSYDQLVAAREWATDLRQNGQFDPNGNLIQDEGLVPIDLGVLDEVDAYFADENWLLGEEERGLAINLYGERHMARVVRKGTGPDGKPKTEVIEQLQDRNWDKIQVLDKFSPDLAGFIEGKLAGLSTLKRLDKFDAIAEDAKALFRLDKAIRDDYEARGITDIKTATDRATEQSAADGQQEKDDISENAAELIELGLGYIDVDKAIAGIQAANSTGERLDIEELSGLSPKQKTALLEYFGYKAPDEKPDIDPRTLRPTLGAKEWARRKLNGSHRKPNVVKRQRLEAKSKLARMKLAADEALSNPDTIESMALSEGEKAILRGRAGVAERKIPAGSRLNPEKYGSAVTRAEQEKIRKTYSETSLVAALQELRSLQESGRLQRDILIEDEKGVAVTLMAEKLLASVERPAPQPEADPTFTIELDDASFGEVLDAIGTKFDTLISAKQSLLPVGERLKDRDIESISVEAQIAIAKDITDAYFDANGLDKQSSSYNKYVRQTLQAFHKYNMKDPIPSPVRETATTIPSAEESRKVAPYNDEWSGIEATVLQAWEDLPDNAKSATDKTAFLQKNRAIQRSALYASKSLDEAARIKAAFRRFDKR